MEVETLKTFTGTLENLLQCGTKHRTRWVISNLTLHFPPPPFWRGYKVFVILLQISCTLHCESLCIFTAHTADKHVLQVRNVGEGQNHDQHGREELRGLLPYTWVALWIHSVSVQSAMSAAWSGRLCCLTKHRKDAESFGCTLGLILLGQLMAQMCCSSPPPPLDKWAISRGFGFR